MRVMTYLWRTPLLTRRIDPMATDKRMFGVHLTVQEHAMLAQLAAKTGERASVLFRTWLRAQAKKHGLSQA